MLFLALALLGTGCASVEVPNVRPCAEIPFLDGPEGACVWTVSKKTEIVPAEEWKKLRPKLIMIDAKSWTAIKLSWLKACRYAGADCNVQVQSIESVILKLDSLAKRVLQPEGKK